MKKHQKHAKLNKPSIGSFARNEIALVGAPCGLIQDFAKKLIGELQDQNITYIDADHAHGNSESPELSFNELTDKIKYERLDKKSLNEYDKRILLNDQDLIITNGNHFEAKSQIVFIHPSKEASLKKRLSQLTDVKAYVLCEGVSKVYEWLEVFAPIFGQNDAPAIAKLIKSQITPPLVKGLVLAGGKSMRMGEDKGQINYHGLAQVDFLFEEFEKAKITASVSCRVDQYERYNRITDKFEGLGPFGAIASAFQEDPNSAWLIVACDLPLVDQDTFDLLLKERDPSKLATCFYNPETDFPDPLITLWEPKAYMRMLEFLALGYSCPRKVLINSDVKIVHLENPEILKNVNTKAELEAFKVDR
ncbi:Molybdopterin-guanine dinucleotide biosynthesis protein A [Spirosomataceae bacterium TFI 002]|nr:Molybdopterin-guanine dinucleotide biosynthesis protein A [Spirosomataceae bacterium TFI 002]